MLTSCQFELLSKSCVLLLQELHLLLSMLEFFLSLYFREFNLS